MKINHVHIFRANRQIPGIFCAMCSHCYGIRLTPVDETKLYFRMNPYTRDKREPTPVWSLLTGYRVLIDLAPYMMVHGVLRNAFL